MLVRVGLGAVCICVGCYSPTPQPGAQCSPEGSCPSGLVCANGICTIGRPDGGHDADGVDGSGLDATTEDGARAFAVRINIGGPAHTGVDYSGAWSADPGVGGICNGTVFESPTAGINGTNDAVLFVEQMFSPTLSCAIANIPSGSYRVTLLFAELRLGGSPCVGPSGASRVFDIALEGVTVASDFDMTAACGGCSASGGTGSAIDRGFDIDIVDGTLDLTAVASTGAAAINAIAVVAR
ncbi:MAG TPA: malectin domain-containing carbohydrate-binding protein [Kofleriaceae bacterium]